MKFNIDSKVMAFTLLNALPQTPEWNMFTSSVINTTEQDKFTFDAIEVRVMSEHAHLHPTGFSELALKVKLAKQGNDKWCEHHQASGHETKECFSYER
jgi:hypothetical protein